MEEEEVHKLTSGNPILDKNLECIACYNPQLKEKLLSLPYLTNAIDLIETDIKEPNLSYNGLPLHDQKGAEAEAKDLFERAEDELFCINVILGMGLGHLFKEFCEKTEGSVLLYEPNLEILRVTLELVDFSKELSQENVKVASDFHEMKTSFELLFRYKTEANFLFLKSYEQLHSEEEINKVLRQIQILKGICTEQFNLVRQKGIDFIHTVLNTLPETLDATPLYEFKDIYKGKTALIISAGPTLDLNIETIKKNRDKIVIFCVGTAFKSLASHGITPDFINVIEVSDCSGQLKGYDLSNVNLIIEPFVHSAFHKFKVKKKLLYPSFNTTGSQYWNKVTGMNISKYMSGGTVSYEALECAKMLGFKRLVLVGQDLAYVNNQCYCNNGAYSDMMYELDSETKEVKYIIKDKDRFLEDCSSSDENTPKEEIEKFAQQKLKDYNDTTCFVKSITGEMLPTLAPYALFVDLFREFAYRHQDTDYELINTSMLGAQIDGFINIPLEKVLKELDPIQKVDFSKKYDYDKKLILENLTKQKEMLETILKEIEKTKEYFYKFERNYNHNQQITNDSYKYMNLILGIYDHIALTYFNNDLLFRVISINETLDLKHYVDTKKESDIAKIKNVYNFAKIYFLNVEAKTLKTIEEIDKQINWLEKDIESKKLLTTKGI